MKTINIIFTALILVFELNINAQSNKVVNIEYNIDSIPMLIEFNTDVTKYIHSDCIDPQ
jgi:hypothetical protein